MSQTSAYLKGQCIELHNHRGVNPNARIILFIFKFYPCESKGGLRNWQ